MKSDGDFGWSGWLEARQPRGCLCGPLSICIELTGKESGDEEGSVTTSESLALYFFC